MELPDFNDSQSKECVIMVGLPARGKSFISYRINRYLNWIKCDSKIFNLGSYRRKHYNNDTCDHSFFDTNNEEGLRMRNKFADDAIEDMFNWFEHGGRVAFLDATNSTEERRKMVYDKLTSRGVKTLFIESICTDKQLLEQTIKNVKTSSPDYNNVLEKNEAVKDFQLRMEHYEKAYVTINANDNENHYSYIKMFNAGRHFQINLLKGYIQTKIACFLLNQNIFKKTIYLVRHGETEFDVAGKVGGDSELTEKGKNFAKILVEYVKAENVKNLKVFTSTNKSAISSASSLPFIRCELKELSEIHAGTCDSMTYEEISEKHPLLYEQRKKDKFNFRYPLGESYRDVFSRIEGIIIELERQNNTLVVSHQAVIRCLLSYFLNITNKETPYIKVPLNCIFKLNPKFCGCDLEIIQLSDTSSTDFVKKATQLEFNKN